MEKTEGPVSHLEPEGGALADSGELGRLEVSESKRGERLVLLSERGEAVNDDGELVEDELETVPEEDEVGVAAKGVSLLLLEQLKSENMLTR